MVYVDDLERPTPAADDAHHLATVLRLRPGEPVVAADGHGALAALPLPGPGSGAGRDRRPARSRWTAP